LFRSSSLLRLFSGHFNLTYDPPSAFAQRGVYILRFVVLLGGVLEVCVRMECDDSSLSKYFPMFIIKISGLMDPNTLLNVSTFEYETTAPSRNSGSQLCTVHFDGSLQTRRMDTSEKNTLWNPQ
jgi:hypothetical protein